jgi:hypothetical protein
MTNTYLGGRRKRRKVTVDIFEMYVRPRTWSKYGVADEAPVDFAAGGRRVVTVREQGNGKS